MYLRKGISQRAKKLGKTQENLSQIAEHALFISLHQGVYALPADNERASFIEGGYAQNVLFVLDLEPSNIWNLKAVKQMNKLITAMQIKRKSLSLNDIGLINVQMHKDLTLTEIIDKAVPNFAIVMLDQWKFKDKEIPNLIAQPIKEISVLRLPSFNTITKNAEQRNASWNAIKRYLNMQ